jgi:hypothetical protein
MVTEGSNDSIGLFASSEDLLEDGDNVRVEVALAGEGVYYRRDVDLASCKQTSEFILELLIFCVSIQQELNVRVIN